VPKPKSKPAAKSKAKPAAKPSVKSGSKAKPKLPPVKETDSEDEQAEPMSYAEKKSLADKIKKLPSLKLARIRQIISNREDSKGDSEDAEIDFATLKPKTLRELEAFVKTCKPEKKVSTRKPSGAASRPSTRKSVPNAKSKSSISFPQFKKGSRDPISLSASSSSETSSDSSSDSEPGKKDQLSPIKGDQQVREEVSKLEIPASINKLQSSMPIPDPPQSMQTKNREDKSNIWNASNNLMSTFDEQF